tara:strand:- start:117 stop:770 length:654 start_codon:yes stop_codon:yes gene_type:complete
MVASRIPLKAAIAIAVLASLYAAAQILSDVSSLKITKIFGYTIDGGTLIYPITFTLRDLIHKVAGKQVARALIVVAALVNLFMAGLFWAVNSLPLLADSGIQSELFGYVLGPVWRIVLASILAEIVSELVDTEVYSAWVTRFGHRKQWGRVLVSNAVAIPLDSVLFASIAFAGVVSGGVLQEIIITNMVIKGLVTVMSVPLIYSVRGDALIVRSNQK